MTPKFIRIADAQVIYSISRNTICRALDSGELTRNKRGRAVLLEVAELDAWVRGEEFRRPDTAAA